MEKFALAHYAPAEWEFSKAVPQPSGSIFFPLGLSLVPENHRAIGQKVRVGVVTAEKPGCCPVLFKVVEKLRTKLVQCSASVILEPLYMLAFRQASVTLTHSNLGPNHVRHAAKYR